MLTHINSKHFPKIRCEKSVESGIPQTTGCKLSSVEFVLQISGPIDEIMKLFCYHFESLMIPVVIDKYFLDYSQPKIPNKFSMIQNYLKFTRI